MLIPHSVSRVLSRRRCRFFQTSLVSDREEAMKARVSFLTQIDEE
jgi:hypothetical protein